MRTRSFRPSPQPWGGGFARRDLRVIVGDFLRDKQLLLVLDNFEHVLPAALHVSEMLAHTPRLKVLSTSRAPLRISGEHVFEVPLKLPPPRQAVTPAALRTRRRSSCSSTAPSRPGLVSLSTPANAPDVAGICLRLDGLPLALELAASQVRLYSPGTLLDRLNHRIGARFRTLSIGDADLPRHHHTLYDMIDWSYGLLDEPQQQLFRRLAVFVGGCSLEAAETVCDIDKPIPAGESGPVPSDYLKSDVVVRLGVLVDHSLVQQSEGWHGAARYTMLETIRDFAAQQLELSGEVELLRRRHAQHFSRQCQFDIGSPTWAARSTEALRWVASERGNLYAALVWSREYEENPVVHLYLSCAIGWLVHVGGWYLGMRGDDPAIESELEWSLARNPALPAVKRAELLPALAMLAYRRGDVVKAGRIMAECMPLSQSAGNKWIEINACHIAAWTAYVGGDFADAGHWFGRQFKLARECDDRMWMLNGLNMLGRVAIQQQDYTCASAWLEQALELAHEMGVLHSIGGGVSTALRDLAVVAHEQGRYVQAYELAGKAAPLFEEGDRAESSWLDLLMGRAAFALGDADLAEQHLVECLRAAREYSQLGLAKAVLAQLARIAWLRGDRIRYARLMSAVAAPPHAEKSLAPISGTRLELERLVAEAQSCLGDPDFAGEWDAGRIMGLHEAIDYVLEL